MIIIYLDRTNIVVLTNLTRNVLLLISDPKISIAMMANPGTIRNKAMSAVLCGITALWFQTCAKRISRESYFNEKYVVYGAKVAAYVKYCSFFAIGPISIIFEVL